MTKEEAELKKIELEIKRLKLPFWKNPAYLTILVTLIIGFSSYYVTVGKAKRAQIADLRTEIEKLEQQKFSLEQQENSLERTKEELKADHYQRQYEYFKDKKEEIERSIQVKELRFINLEDKLKRSEVELTKVESSIQNQEKEYEQLKIQYDDYKAKVNKVIEEVEDYSPSYANGLIRSPEGQSKINFIMSITDKNLMKTEIGRFAYGISNQAFDESIARKKLKLEIE